MGDFSAAWLRLREPVDARSRNQLVATALRAAFADRPSIRVVDIGAGTGANLRATAPLLSREQAWTLLDHDQALLDAARNILAAWADHAEHQPDALRIRKDGRMIHARFQLCDIADAPAELLPERLDLVTASAFFDLVSAAFIDRIVAALVHREAAFHTVLTYDGVQAWSPRSGLDEAVRQAFNDHQREDKGFGPAAGPAASSLLRQALQAAGYAVVVGDSPWCLGAQDADLMAQLTDGVAKAVAETGQVPPEALVAWRAMERTGLHIGHEDILALPPGWRRVATNGSGA